MATEAEREALAGKNVGNPVMHVAHKNLERASEDSLYRSVCPVCKEGVFLIHRDQTLRIKREDNCILCGQRVRYIGKLGFFDEEIPLDKF